MSVAQLDQLLHDLDNHAPGYPVGGRNAPHYATSAPLPAGKSLAPYPSALKEVDINKKTGVVTAYLTVYCNDDGTPFVDPYQDIIEPGSFTKTIAALDAARKRSTNPWLCPSLWQHDRHELIGGVARLGEDSKGVIYETHLALGVQRAREALELAERKMIGSSYGYDPIKFTILPGNVRSLKEIALHEQSFVSFPANPLGQILDVKGRHHTAVRLPTGEVDASVVIRELQHVADSMKSARDADHFDPEYEDYRWRLRRAELYQRNPAAFLQNSRFGNYG